MAQTENVYHTVKTKKPSSVPFVWLLLIPEKAAHSALACLTSHTYTRELKNMRRATYIEVALRHISSDPQEARSRTFLWDLRCLFTESKSAGGDKSWSAL